MTSWHVRVRSGDFIHGAGTLVGDRHILTCAHVVNQALGRPDGEREPPNEPIDVDFPAARGDSRRTARVAVDAWIPIDEDGRGDIAVLTLTQPGPNGVRPARLARETIRGTPVHVLGYPRHHDHGIEAQAVVSGSGGPGGEWVQLDAERATGYRIQQGFSGAGVVDSNTGAVIGVLILEEKDASAKIAWMVPLARIGEYFFDTSIDLRLVSETTSKRTAVNTLPPAVPDFAGRETELEKLRRAISGNGETVLVPYIFGMGGAGKTALAVRFAHELTGHYPDAQLFIDLQATTAGQELAPDVAIARLLRTLGVVPNPLPHSTAEWTELWRGELSRRRVVVLLDNAASAAQVRPMIPGTHRSLVLITSRVRLAGLEQATEHYLDVLPHQDTRLMLTRIVGAERITKAPAAVDRIVVLTGRLPLAVRLVAARLRGHPTWSLADVLTDLDNEHSRLAELSDDSDDVRAGGLSVRATFDLSYGQLSDEEKRQFRRLSLHPTAEFGTHAAAALDGTDLRVSRRVLARLVNYSLLAELSRDRFRLHDLVREYAHELAMATETPEQRHQAVERVLDHYLRCSVVAHTTLLPFRALADEGDRHATTLPDLGTSDSARAWFAREHTNLLACPKLAREHALPGYGWRIPRAMGHYLGLRANVEDASIAFGLGLEAARAAGDPTGLADMNIGLADVHYAQGDNQQALSELTSAYEGHLGQGDRVAAGDVLNRMGRSLRALGSADEARHHHQQALDTLTEIGDRYGQAESHLYLGMLDRVTGSYDSAMTNQEKAVELYRQLPSEIGEGRSVAAIGMLHRLSGDYRAAIRCFDTALALYQRNHDRRGVAHALNNTASSLLLLNEPEEARTQAEEALAIFREIGNYSGEADASVVMGRACRATHSFPESRRHLHRALLLSRKMSSRSGEANALLELSRSRRAEGDAAGALNTSRHSLSLYRSLNSARGTAIASLEVARCLHATHDQEARATCVQALELCEERGLPETAEARDLLAAIDDTP
ncbi:tetratricopeptide repeat protein [Actinophytocola sediminis]